MSTWLLWMFGTTVTVVVFGKDLALEPGNLKPFGDGRPSQSVEELDYFPTAEEFFKNYVKPLKPVKMTGAAKMSAAFEKWTDDYFLTLDEPSENRISVETVKKEIRHQDMDSMQFKEFVKMYNNTEHYMVDSVPFFLRHEVMIPCPLQCRQLIKSEFKDNVMWYSSGGTKSVVHTDTVENINCLYRGDKTLVFVDPGKYADKVEMLENAGHSAIDVDSVDYEKFPGMAEVEFYHVNITAGDCLYIPYMWIHQVRSFGSNLAVNIWWKHELSSELDYTQCSEPCNPEMTLDHAVFHGLDDELDDSYDLEELRRMFLSLVSDPDGIPLQQFSRNLFRFRVYNMPDKPVMKQQMFDVVSIFKQLDANKDQLVSIDEIEDASDETWEKVGDILYGVAEGPSEGKDKNGEEDKETTKSRDEL